jgi:hypothetical protein
VIKPSLFALSNRFWSHRIPVELFFSPGFLTVGDHISDRNTQNISFIYKMNWHIYPWDDIKKHLQITFVSSEIVKGAGKITYQGGSWATLSVVYT